MPSLTKVQSGFMEAQGALPLSSGTAAAPGLKFDDHAGTGMFSPSTGAIAFSTSSHQNALTMHTDGSIVISGTTSNVVGRLTLAGDGKDIVFGRTENTGTGGTGRLVATGNLVYVQAGANASSGSSADLIFCNYGGVGERLRITTTGELVSSNGTLRRNVDTSSFAVSGGTASNHGSNIVVYGNNHSAEANVIRFRVGGTETARITSTGVVGINKSSPSSHAQLDVVGSSYWPILVKTTSTGGGGVAIKNKDDVTSLYTGSGGSAWLTGSVITDGLIRTQNNLIFATDGNNERLRIDTAGSITQGGKTASNHGSPNLLLWGADPTLHISATGSTANTSFAGIKFAVAGGSTGDYSKAGIFVQRQSSYNDLDMILAFRSTADTAGVAISDEKLRIASNGVVTITGEDFPYCKATATNKKLVVEEYTSYNSNSGIEIRKKLPNGNVHPANHWYGDIHFKGWDGDQFLRGGLIECVAEGTPSNDSMPGNLRFSTNAGATGTSEALRIASDGKIAIGGNYTETSTFGRQLLVSGTVGLNNDSGNVGMGFHRGTSNTYGYIGTGAWAVSGLNNDDFGISSGATGDLVFGTGASGYSPKMRINNAGNVTLEGDDQFMYLSNVGTGNAGIYVRGNSTSASNSNHFLRSHSTGMFTWEVTGSEKMRITAGGNLGVGNTDPPVKLAIGDTTDCKVLLSSSWTGTQQIIFGGGSSNSTGQASSTAGIIKIQASAPGGKATGDMYFITNKGDVLENNLILTNGGVANTKRFASGAMHNSPAYKPSQYGYMGDYWPYGCNHVYYLAQTSTGNSGYSSHMFSWYDSGHWGNYGKFILFAQETSYIGGFCQRYLSGTTVNTIVGGGQLSGATTAQTQTGTGSHGGQNVYRYDCTVSHSGTYRTVRWYLGVLSGIPNGVTGNGKTQAEAQTYANTNGGLLHLFGVSDSNLTMAPNYRTW